jgi:hypothetical protein
MERSCPKALQGNQVPVVVLKTCQISFYGNYVSEIPIEAQVFSGG